MTFLNGVAEKLTGWWAAEAEASPLAAIFRMVDGETREPIGSCDGEGAARVERLTASAHNGLLIDREGAEPPDREQRVPYSRCAGAMVGVVLVFRDVSAQPRPSRALVASETSYRTLAEGLYRAPDGLRP